NPYVVLMKLADKNLTEYRIHEDTKIIYYRAFASTKMSSISIPYGVRVIGVSAFESSQIKEIELPDSLELIDNSAFSHSKLETLTIPGSTKIIANNAFYENKSLITVTILEGVEIIGEQAFYECWSLKDISLPNSLKDIRYAAFSCSAPSYNYNIYENAYYLGNEDNPYLCFIHTNDSSITSCKIDQHTKFIMDYAFSFCSNLKEIILTKDLIVVNEGVLYNCNKFDTIYYLGTEEDWNEILILNDNYAFETKASRYYYSEEEPTSDGNYWHYVDDVPTLW
ncbi:MAG: leucine-rich repeat domain-containing protein, partial [Anaeroplasmataceae bacterium]|nr:leucine-rich repeat domain-containing protein [Anaeroplasmataceae bacterium]